jgi:hypothetical protein
LHVNLEDLQKFLASEAYRVNFKLACDGLETGKIEINQLPMIKKWL